MRASSKATSRRSKCRGYILRSIRFRTCPGSCRRWRRSHLPPPPPAPPSPAAPPAPPASTSARGPVTCCGPHSRRVDELHRHVTSHQEGSAVDAHAAATRKARAVEVVEARVERGKPVREQGEVEVSIAAGLEVIEASAVLDWRRSEARADC